MPSPIDHCTSCRRPVYANQGTPGECSCPEAGLRVLLAQERARNNRENSDFVSGFVQTPVARPPVARGVRTASQELPDLDPTMFLSPAGRQEMQAAQSMPFPSGRPIRGQTAVATHFDDAGLFEEGSDFGNRTASAAPAVDLESMWMASTGIPYEPGETSSGLDGFEFTTYDPQDIDLDLERPAVGPRNGGARFRVDQPPPARPPVPRPVSMERGPMREVTRVREGRFSVLREDPIPVPREEFNEMVRDALPARPRPSAAELNAKQSAIQQARTLQENAKRPTAYQHLLANSLGDDD
jgi:hypothetical protein